MNFSDERYVRVYTRDTLTWKRLGWEGQALWLLTLRKLDRAGVLDVDGAAVEGLAAMTGVPVEVVERCLPLLISTGTLELRGTSLVAPRFIEAQESVKSPATRQAESRANRRDLVRAGLDPDKRDTQIYFIQSEHGGPIKIGRADDLAKRLVGLQTSRPDKLIVLASAAGTIEMERQIHAAFLDEREKGEWFSASERLVEFTKHVTERGPEALMSVSEFVLNFEARHDSKHVTLAVPCCTVPSRADTATTAKRSKPKPVETPEVRALRESWNELTKPPIPRWTAGRVKAAQAALERRPLEQWREVFERINKSDFLRGQSGKWKADIDWALRPEGTKPEPALKVLEGTYDNGKTPVGSGDWRSREDHNADFFGSDT